MMLTFKRVFLLLVLLSKPVFAGDKAAGKDDLMQVITPRMQEAQQFMKNHPVLAVGLCAFLLAEIRLLTKTPDCEPSRCDLNRLKCSDVNWQDIWSIVDDGIVGQPIGTDELRTDAKGKIVASTLKLPKGILGNIHTYWTPLATAVGFTCFVYLMERAIVDKNSTNILTYLKTNSDEICKAVTAWFLDNSSMVTNV